MQSAETRTTVENILIERLDQQPELGGAIALAQRFIDLVRQRLSNQLDDWLQAAKAISIRAFQSFAKGLEEDYDATRIGTWLRSLALYSATRGTAIGWCVWEDGYRLGFGPGLGSSEVCSAIQCFRVLAWV